MTAAVGVKPMQTIFRALVLVAVACCARPVTAGEPAKPATDHLAALRACKTQVDPGARLACYDAAVAMVVAATDTGELQIVDSAEIKRTRRNLFGFSLPDLGLFGGGSDEPDMDMLETSIASVRYTGSDAFLFKTKEGATWQVTNAPGRLRQVRSGDKVVFKKAAMGSYFIRFAGQIGVKGKRVE
jgi:hypothetical protein